jgi:outer membrane protein OmpA-like peptidoglycan-associated protein
MAMNKRALFGIGGTLLLAGCVTTTPPPNPAIESARAAVQAAEADPNVIKYDPLDLQTARNDLVIAEDAAAHNGGSQIPHAAYVAMQTAHLAQVRATAKADDARVAAGQSERDQIQLAARNREVQNATATAAAATEESARLKAEMEALKASQTSRGMVITLSDVLFNTGKSDLTSGASRKLDELAQVLTEHPDRRVQIDGFTDSVGSDAYNLDLSQQRADAVKSALVSRGVEPARISTQGYGKAYPMASNADAGGRQLNRRVEIVIGGEHNEQIAPRS